ncbi:MAG: AAA family ATPase, partial [Oscillospiraceae bacterium]|nr:AAA family ATPase [Oscillospiraceae bacterium]
MCAKIIFVGNYKGGVGKTTSVLNFAEYFSRKRDCSVLVLDLDPQSSLSEILVSKGNYGTLADLKEQETLNYVFDLNISKIERYPSLDIQFDDSMLVKSFSGYHFIPSSLFY